MENFTQSLLHPEPGNLIAIGIKTFGLFGNTLIIAATISPNSALKSKTNYMLCMLAIFDLFVCFNENILHVLIWKKWFFVNQKLCLMVATPGLFFFFSQAMITWLVGLDRVLLFKIPVKYNMWKTQPYIVTAIGLTSLFGIAMTTTGWLFHDGNQNQTIPVCNLPDSLGAAFKVVTVPLFLVVLLTIVTHIWAYRLAGKSIQSEQSLVSKRRLQRIQQSLLLIVAAFLCSQVVAVLGSIYASTLSAADRINIFFYITGNSTGINISSNMPILFIRSKDYRNQFIKILTCNNVSSHSISIVVPGPHHGGPN